MLYKIINTTNTNLVVNNKTIRLNESLKVDSDTLEQIASLIEDGTIKVEKIKNKKSEIFNKNDEDLIEVFFKFHTNQKLTQQELNSLVYFHKNIGPISYLPEIIKNDLDEVSSEEELIEILINQIYPALIEEFNFKKLQK